MNKLPILITRARVCVRVIASYEIFLIWVRGNVWCGHGFLHPQGQDVAYTCMQRCVVEKMKSSPCSDLQGVQSSAWRKEGTFQLVCPDRLPLGPFSPPSTKAPLCQRWPYLVADYKLWLWNQACVWILALLCGIWQVNLTPVSLSVKYG